MVLWHFFLPRGNVHRRWWNLGFRQNLEPYHWMSVCLISFLKIKELTDLEFHVNFCVSESENRGLWSYKLWSFKVRWGLLLLYYTTIAAARCYCRVIFSVTCMSICQLILTLDKYDNKCLNYPGLLGGQLSPIISSIVAPTIIVEWGWKIGV